jgi:hypothetical protein
MPGASQKGKASVGKRAEQFLASIGTAGGAVGAPGLVTFGAGNLQEQLSAAQMNPYLPIQQEAVKQGTVVGSPHASNMAPGLSTPSMPRDFDSGYMHLNIPGSPLPMYGLMAAHNKIAAHGIQNQSRAMQQHALLPFMPLTGQLPVDPMMVQQQMTPQKGQR